MNKIKELDSKEIMKMSTLVMKEYISVMPQYDWPY